MREVLNKNCPMCHQDKPLTAFSNDKSRSDGLYAYCKACDNKRCRERFKTHHTTEQYKARRRKSQLKYVADHPERARARMLAMSVPLAAICEGCGVKTATHRHHPDYSKPLEVISLCVGCHEDAHHGVRA